MNGQALSLLFLLAILTQPKAYQRLQRGMRMTKGDELISTLGLYKVIMNDNDCSLNFFKFDIASTFYLPMNQKIIPNNTNSCTYLQVLDRSIVTNSSTVFLQLASSNLSKTYLIIDDNAILRFVGIKNPSNSPIDYEQITINNYSQPNKFVSILESHTQISDKLTTVTNNKNWSFQVNGNTLTITNTVSQFSQSFTLPTVYFDVNGIYDSNNQTLPGAIFQGILLGAVCGEEKSHLYGPFILQVSSYWPTVTIYDQDKYKVFQFSIVQNQELSNSNSCPKFTFILNDQCYSTCPAPYFHQIKQSWGRCVLFCQVGSTIDLISKTCKCPNRISYLSANYNCINGSIAYPFGCFCQNNTYFDRSSYTCVPSCPNRMTAYLGLCLNCSKGCLQCSISFNGLYFLTCTQCTSGYTLTNGACIYATSCTTNCLTCNNANSICTACQPFYILSNGACIESCSAGVAKIMKNLSSTCSSQANADQCGVQCLKCTSDSSCIVCQNGFSLLVSPISITCRKKNVYYTCQALTYAYSSGSNVCYSNDTNSMTKLSTCKNSINNCLICHPTLTKICLLCNNNLFLQQNACVSRCSSNYYPINQACLPVIANCQLNSFISGRYKQTFTHDTLSNNPFYRNYIRNGSQITNQPYGFSLYFRQQFMLNTDTSLTSDGQIEWTQQICSQCQKGYGLTSDHSTCIPCPSGCLLCLYATTCIAATNDQVLALTLGTGMTSCQSFLSQENECLQSCPTNTYPVMNQTLNKVVCENAVSSSQSKYLRIDGSTYVISDRQYIHRFIFDFPVKIPLKRLLQQGNPISIDPNGNSITFSSKYPTQVLNLSGNIGNITSQNGLYPVNSVYGINDDTSFRSYIKKWLAGIGYVLSIFIILLQCIYVANGILYKMDNIIIFAQSLFFFLFNQTLIANPVAQYYYGWSWTHLNFFPNYFTPDLDLSQPTIPPYALYNLDGNIIRNAGSTLSVLLTFFMAWGAVSFVLYILDTKYGRKQIWYQTISKNALIATVEFFSYNIFYWCMAFISHDKNYSNSGTFIGLSVLLLTVLIIYLIGRFYMNLTAGLYMVKRLLFACVLASSYQKVGYVGIMILLQACFGVARSLIQRPRQKWLLVSLWVQQFLLIIFWVILYTTVNASVISILTTIFVYAWMLTFVADLSDIYFNSKNMYVEVSCFRKLFQEKGKETEPCRSNESVEKHQNGNTDRPLNSNVAGYQKH